MNNYPYPVSESQREILDWVRGFASEHMAPVAAKHDREESTPWEMLRAASKIGLYSLEFMMNALNDPDGTLLAMITEELAAVDAGQTLALLGTMLPATAISTNGTLEQMGTWLPRCFGTADEPQVAAFVASESDAGSDVGAIRTRAVRDGEHWVLNGTKTWGTNAGIADVHVITAVVDPELGARGQAAFVISARDTEGIRQGSKFSKMGIRASHTAEVVLENCRIPAGQVLGGVEKLEERLARARSGQTSRGQAAMRTFEATRPLVAAMAVGISRAAYEYALEYTKQRVQFGRPVIENQGVAFQLAEMRTRIDAARLLTHRAARIGALGERFDAAEGSQAKLYAGEAAVWVTDRAISLLGGAGYVTDHPVEKWHRDSKIFTIFEGTSEIQRLVIARAISGMRIE